MLARLARTLPQGDDLRFEPKWDGFRTIAFRDGESVDLRSRNHRPLGRYFPEIVVGLEALGAAEVVIDGELLARVGDQFDFSALLSRLHPAASRVERLRHETPALYVAFDVLAVGTEDLRLLPFGERRRVLESLPLSSTVLTRTPSTSDIAVAERWLDQAPGSGVDGVMVKDVRAPYLSGKRAMTKVKRQRTADCVVAGFRWLPDRPEVASLLLGLHDNEDQLRHVGVASSFTRDLRRTLLKELAPLVTMLEGHPWELGYGLEGGPIGRLQGVAGRWTPEFGYEWVPLRPERVCEVIYEHVESGRLRHPARFLRWRPDRDAATCTIDQFVTTTSGAALA